MPDGFVRHGMQEARGSSPLSSTLRCFSRSETWQMTNLVPLPDLDHPGVARPFLAIDAGQRDAQRKRWPLACPANGLACGLARSPVHGWCCPLCLQDPRVFRGESRGSSCVCVRTAVTNQVTNAAGLPVARRSHGGKGARARRPQPVRHARTGYRCFPSLRDFKSCRSRGYCAAEDAAMPLIALWDSQTGSHSVIRATPARLVATLFSVAMPRYVR